MKDDIFGKWIDWNGNLVYVGVTDDTGDIVATWKDSPPENASARFPRNWTPPPTWRRNGELAVSKLKQRGCTVNLGECPHPEWLGVWKDLAGYGVWIKWKNGSYCINRCSSLEIRGSLWPGPINAGWTMVERAPTEASANFNPRETFETPWDPFGGFYD